MLKGRTPYNDIADAHNAAIAVQRQAAEQGKVKPLVEALEAIRDNGRYDGNHLASIARDALAKESK
jgi:hypothetical protein